jgi:hypothetical protein
LSSLPQYSSSPRCAQPGAGGHGITCFGEKQLELCIAGRRFEWTFLLAAVEDPTIGADFLCHFKLIVNLSAGCLMDAETLQPLGSSASQVGGGLMAVLEATPPRLRALISQFPEVVNATGKLPPIKHSVQHVIVTAGRPVTAKFRRLDAAKLAAAKAEFLQLERDVITTMLRGRYLAAGSIILLYSSMNLALAGTSGYCADLIAAIERLKVEIGEHVVYTPLPQDQMTIRLAVEVGAWAVHYFGKDNNLLKESFEVANDIMEEAGTGGHQAEVASRHRLSHEGRTYTTWFTSGLTSLPVEVRPATKEREQLLLTKIIGEVRKGLAIDLEPTPSFERGVAPVMAPPEQRQTPHSWQ